MSAIVSVYSAARLSLVIGSIGGGAAFRVHAATSRADPPAPSTASTLRRLSPLVRTRASQHEILEQSHPDARRARPERRARGRVGARYARNPPPYAPDG